MLADYGLADPDTDLGAPVDPSEVWTLFGALVGEEVAPLIETAQPDAMTRGELAEALMAFMSGLEGAE